VGGTVAKKVWRGERLRATSARQASRGRAPHIAAAAGDAGAAAQREWTFQL